MGIGFAFMVAGKDGGRRVARFYFGGSVRWVVAHGRAFVRWILASIAALVARAVALLWFASREHLLGPLARHLRRGLRWSFAARCRVTVMLALVVLCALTLVVLAAPAGAQSVSVRAQNKMFRTDVTLNDQVKLRALIDTGASYLSLCAATARALNLQLGETVRLTTANGVISARRASVRSVRIEAIEVNDVAAVVKGDAVPCAEGEILVGMSLLSKLHVTLNDDTLILVAGWRQNNGAMGFSLHWLWVAAVWAVVVFCALVVSSN
jgi:clan AA aspartic protease (TIGR02281 family)